MAKAKKEPSFEEAMERLEQTVEQMEGRDLPLEQIIKKYEEGIRLVEVCEKKLSAAEKKIELLTRTQSGKVKVSEFKEAQPSTDSQDEDDSDEEVSLF